MTWHIITRGKVTQYQWSSASLKCCNYTLNSLWNSELEHSGVFEAHFQHHGQWQYKASPQQLRPHCCQCSSSLEPGFLLCWSKYPINLPTWPHLLFLYLLLLLLKKKKKNIYSYIYSFPFPTGSQVAIELKDFMSNTPLKFFFFFFFLCQKVWG